VVTVADFINHYNAQSLLALTAEEMTDLAEYLSSV